MSATVLVSAADAFGRTEPPTQVAPGIPVHVLTTAQIDDAPLATEHARHDALQRVRHVGWYVDAFREATLTGHVYVHEPDDGDAPASFYAAALSDDTDIHYLDPGVYDDPVDAAVAADEIARIAAEHQLEYDETRLSAETLRCELRRARELHREAFDLLRHACGCPADAAALGPAFARLHARAAALRSRVLADLAQQRPSPPRPGTEHPHPLAVRWLAWRDGWDNA